MGESVLPALRASDGDRDRVASVLREHAVSGRLTLEELAERLDRTYAARTIPELENLTSDLPALRAAPVSRRKPVRFTIAFIGDVRRQGRWRVAKYSGAIALIGDCVLDLRQAELSDDEVTIEIFSVIGDTTVIVPETIEVEVTGLTIIGETHERVRDTPRPGAPLVRLRILSLIGDVTVRTG